MDSIHITYIEVGQYDEYESPNLVIKPVESLTKGEQLELSKHLKVQYEKTKQDLERDLKEALNSLGKRTVEKILKENGYLPANKAENIEDISVHTDKFYYRDSSLGFKPLKSDWYTSEALRQPSDNYYAKITFGKNHPFFIARKEYKEKQEKKKKAKEEKKRQKELERAKKLLKEEGVLE